jgi:hypothetical protein
MEIEFSQEAKTEFDEGVQYYERQLTGLGSRFRTDVRNSLVRLRNWPLATAVERGDIRRMLLSRFPYKILYSIEPDKIYILALAHQHRAPGYWTERSKPILV